MSLDDQEPLAPLPFTPARATLWMLGASLLMVMALLMLLSMNPAAEKDHVSLGALSAAVFLGVSALLVGKYPAGPHISEAIGLRPCSPGLVGLGFLIGASAQIPAEAIALLTEKIAPLSEQEAMAREALFSDVTPVRAVALVIVLTGLVPLAEESFFRGAIFGALRRDGSAPWIAALVAGIGFVLCHFNLRLLLPIGLVAVILGILRASSGSLWPSLAAHAAFNAVTVVSGVTRWQAPELGVTAQLGGAAFCGLAVYGAFSLARRSGRALQNRADEAQVGEGAYDDESV